MDLVELKVINFLLNADIASEFLMDLVELKERKNTLERNGDVKEVSNGPGGVESFCEL